MNVWDKEEAQAVIAKADEMIKKLQNIKAEAGKELENQVKNIIPAHYSSKGEYYHSDGDTIYCDECSGCGCVDFKMIIRYEAFKTKEMCEFADKISLFARKLAYFKEIFDKDYKPDWKDTEENKYCVFYNYHNSKYVIGCTFSNETKSDVYFSDKEVAQKCADWLNRMEEK